MDCLLKLLVLLGGTLAICKKKYVCGFIYLFIFCFYLQMEVFGEQEMMWCLEYVFKYTADQKREC